MLKTTKHYYPAICVLEENRIMITNELYESEVEAEKHYPGSFLRLAREYPAVEIVKEVVEPVVHRSLEYFQELKAKISGKTQIPIQTFDDSRELNEPFL